MMMLVTDYEDDDRWCAVHRVSAHTFFLMLNILQKKFEYFDILSCCQGGAEDEVQEPVLPTRALQGEDMKDFEI